MKKTLNTNFSILRNSDVKKLLKYFFVAMVVFSFASCDDDDEQIDVKDYGLKTFSADYNYSNKTYMDQVYFSFSDSLLGTATQETDDWTTFYLISDSSQYNVTSDYVSDWDLVFSNYTILLNGYYVHSVTGVLINSEENIKVGSMEYTDSEDEDAISSAFTGLSISDIDTISYSSDVDAIGYSWKSLDHTTYVYSVNTNYFYFLKLDEETYYKLRFISFYGASTDERIATIQYQLMQ